MNKGGGEVGCSLFKLDLSKRRPGRLSAKRAAISALRNARDMSVPDLKSLSNYPEECFQASMTLIMGSHCKQKHTTLPAPAAAPSTGRRRMDG